MKENVKNTTKALYTMCICLIVVMGVLFLGNSLTKGTYSAAVVPDIDGNVSCDKGKYLDSNNKCVTCGAGKLCIDGKTQMNCKAGYYCTGTSQHVCGTGKYCIDGKRYSCDAGKTTNTETSTSESDCISITSPDRGAGCYVSGNAPLSTAKRYPRDPGTGYSLVDDKNCDKTCGAGKYINEGDLQSGCTDCEIGFYCVGDNSITQCPNGKTTNGRGKTSENDCIDSGESPGGNVTGYKIFLYNAEGNEHRSTCNTGTNGIITSCTVTPSTICESWSTTKYDKNNDTQEVAITSGALMTNKFTSNVTYYCKAGTSQHPGGNPSYPSNPSNPSSNPSTSSNPPSSSTVTENPKTGSIAIFMVWVIAIGTLIYSIAYFKQSKFE